MDRDIWAKPKEVAWNYIVVIDSSANSSRVDVFRYADEKPEGLPIIETQREWSKTFVPGLVGSSDLGRRFSPAYIHKLRNPRAYGATTVLSTESATDSTDSVSATATATATDTKTTSLWSLTSSELAASTTMAGSEDDGPMDSGLAQHIAQIVSFTEEIIPGVQVNRTPVFLHATGQITNFNQTYKHRLLRDTCHYLKTKSDFILTDCQKQVYDISGDNEAALGWLTINSDTRHGNVLQDGLIELSAHGLQAAYISDDSNKSQKDRIAIGKGNGDNLYFDVSTDSYDLGYETVWEQYLKDVKDVDGKLSCVQEGLTLGGLEGSGNYDKCSQALSKYFDQVSSINADARTFVAAGQFASFLIDYFENKPEELKSFCETPWSRVEELDAYKKLATPDLEKLCFRAVYAQGLIEKGFFKGSSSAIKDVSYLSKAHGIDYSWSYGRAILYAADEVSGAKNPSGIQANVGASRWSFGVEAGMERPALVVGGDSADRFDKVSHRMYGGIVFMILLAGVLYFLLGKSRRENIWKSLRQRTGYKDLDQAPGDFELDDLNEYEMRHSDDEFEVGR